MKNDTPKVPSVSSSETVSLPAGKNSFAMMTAKKPYTTRSNHSSALPIEAATTARHEFRRLPARLAAVVAFMQISNAREILLT